MSQTPNHDQHIVLINIFTVKPEKADALLAVLARRQKR